jgi:hypothetical protein
VNHWHFAHAHRAGKRITDAVHVLGKCEDVGADEIHLIPTSSNIDRSGGSSTS